MADGSTLVSCDWLSEALKSGTNIVVLDVSWSSTRDMKEDFTKSHISGSRYLDVLNATHSPLYPRNVPDIEAFQKMARSVGVNSDSHVVVYSNTDKCGFFLAGRAWWTFKLYGHAQVSILNGGWPKWVSSGNVTSRETTEITEGNFVAQRNDSFYFTFDDVTKNIDSAARQVVDSRPPSAYSGSEKAGHVPGAKNLSLATLMDEENGVLKPEEELKSMFAAAGVDVTKPAVTYCNSGMSSCSLAMALKLCGCPDVAVFHGGWTEYSKKSADAQDK